MSHVTALNRRLSDADPYWRGVRAGEDAVLALPWWRRLAGRRAFRRLVRGRTRGRVHVTLAADSSQLDEALRRAAASLDRFRERGSDW